MERTEIIGELADLAERAKESEDIALAAVLFAICAVAVSTSRLRDQMLAHIAKIAAELGERLTN